MKPNQVKRYFLLIFLIFGTGCGKNHWPSLSTLYRDQLASDLIKKKKNEEAFNIYLKNLEDNSDAPSLYSNIGILLEESQKSEDALKSLLMAKKLADQQDDTRLQFAIHFNLGAYYGQKKKYKEALEAYQQALEVVPNSKEVKHNIELLIQQQQKDQKQDQNKDQKQDQNKDQNKDQKQQQGQSGEEKKDQQDNKDQKQDKDKDKDKQMQNSPKYKPRPFQGDQLSEGDVKKILGELRNQEQKIRANFDKKERKEKRNEKDW